jgi:hypothetical protein
LRRASLALVTVLVIGCTMPGPSTITTRAPHTSPPSSTPSQAPTSLPSDAALTPCTGDIVFSGGYTGETHGPIVSNVRQTGNSPDGAVIDTRFPATVDGIETGMLFALWDPDGPAGPGPVNGLFGPERQTAVQDAPLTWQEDTGVGTATVQPDGSHANFDVVFTGLRPDTSVVGTLTCAPFR